MRAEVGAVAWSVQTSRATELAASVGGISLQLSGRLPRRSWTAPLRYLINTVETLLWLAWRRPRALIVQNPPIFLAILAWLYGRVAGAPFVLDSHPVSFGAKKSVVWSMFLPVHRWLAVRASAVLVTTPQLAAAVDRWGGNGVVVHEAPVALPEPSSAIEPDLRRVLFVCVFASDEPVDEVLAAARLLGDIEVRITGDRARAAPGLIESAPANVEFVGFLDRQAYAEELYGAGAVIALTTERESVQRCAYETVYAGRALVISDFPIARDVFPHAFFVSNNGESIAGGVRAALSDPDPRGRAQAAEAVQIATWQQQLSGLRSAVATARGAR